MSRKKGEYNPNSVNSCGMKIFNAELPIGAPPTTIDDLPENWQEILDACAEDGGTMTQLVVNLKISRARLKSLIERDENFFIKYSECMEKSRMWWEDAGKKLTNGAYKDGKAAAWTFMMANRFGYRAKTEISGNAEYPLEIKQDVTVTNKQLTKEQLIRELECRGLPTSIFNND